MNNKVLNALAEPTRQRIVELLKYEPRSVNEVAAELNLSQPQASKHLKYLAEAGLVTIKPLAQQRIYVLNPEPFNQLTTWLESFRRNWEKRLNSLDEHLKKG